MDAIGGVGLAARLAHCHAIVASLGRSDHTAAALLQLTRDCAQELTGEDKLVASLLWNTMEDVQAQAKKAARHEAASQEESDDDDETGEEYDEEEGEEYDEEEEEGEEYDEEEEEDEEDNDDDSDYKEGDELVDDDTVLESEDESEEDQSEEEETDLEDQTSTSEPEVEKRPTHAGSKRRRGVYPALTDAAAATVTSPKRPKTVQPIKSLLSRQSAWRRPSELA